jgi:RNA polymerase sigma factor (TIGR02999 family)
MDSESAPDGARTGEPSDFTRLLQAHAAGDPGALHQLVPKVYDELRAMARGRMRGERPEHTLGATDLVHEAFMRLVRLDRIAWRNRAHFLAIASQAMRHVLLDHADQRRAGKRGGGAQAITLDRLPLPANERDDAVIALCEALEELERVAPRQARIVECRFFAGLSIDETAAALGISAATVSREWTVARAWLHAQLDNAPPDARD